MSTANYTMAKTSAAAAKLCGGVKPILASRLNPASRVVRGATVQERERERDEFSIALPASSG